MESDEFGLDFPNSLPKFTFYLASSPNVMCNVVLEALLGRADNGEAAKYRLL